MVIYISRTLNYVSKAPSELSLKWPAGGGNLISSYSLLPMLNSRGVIIFISFFYLSTKSHGELNRVVVKESPRRAIPRGGKYMYNYIYIYIQVIELNKSMIWININLIMVNESMLKFITGGT